jgi:hypothetical protein
MQNFDEWFEDEGSVLELRRELQASPTIQKALKYLAANPYNPFDKETLPKAEPGAFAYALGYNEGQSEVLKSLTGMATPRKIKR